MTQYTGYPYRGRIDIENVTRTNAVIIQIRLQYDINLEIATTTLTIQVKR